jgi:hypothetical protein
MHPSSWSRTPHELGVCAETKSYDNAFLRLFSYGPPGGSPVLSTDRVELTKFCWRFSG